MAETGLHKKSSNPAADESVVELAAAPPPEVEVKEDVPLYKRRKVAILACCGALAGLIGLLGILILILALAVLKAKQPVITINNVVLDNIPSFNVSDLAHIHVNFSIDVDVSVYNPNHASFRYTNSTSYMYYRQLQVGEAPIPAGRIGARGSERLTTTLRLNASSSLLAEPHLLSDLAAGSFPISTTAQVSGRVNILNIFKHHARSSSYCTMSISLASQSVQNMTCTSRVKL